MQSGGMEQFREDFLVNNEVNQEDDELVSICQMNPEEFDIPFLLERGLSLDIEKKHSDDFVILFRYGGRQWEASWLEDNSIFAWHKNCNQDQIQKAKSVGNMTMIEVGREIDKGNNILATIRR